MALKDENFTPKEFVHSKHALQFNKIKIKQSSVNRPPYNTEKMEIFVIEDEDIRVTERISNLNLASKKISL